MAPWQRERLGSGGRGQGTRNVGQPYGDVYQPLLYGSNGGSCAHYGRLLFGQYTEGTHETTERAIHTLHGANPYYLDGQGGQGGGKLREWVSLVQLRPEAPEAEDVAPGDNHRFKVAAPRSQGGIGLPFDDRTRSASAWRVSLPSDVMAYNGAWAR